MILAGMGKRFNFTDAGEERGDVIIDRDFGVGANAVYLDKKTKKEYGYKGIAVSRKIEKENVKRRDACSLCCDDESEREAYYDRGAGIYH